MSEYRNRCTRTKLSAFEYETDCAICLEPMLIQSGDVIHYCFITADSVRECHASCEPLRFSSTWTAPQPLDE